MQLKVELELIITSTINEDTKCVWEKLIGKIFKQAENEAKTRKHFQKTLDDQKKEISVEG